MDRRIDFLRYLDTDLSLRIMSLLDDVDDIVRFCDVSDFWCKYAIRNGVAKQTCFRLFPQLRNVAYAVDISKGTDVPTEWENLEREQDIYIALLQALTKSSTYPRDCIESAISASTTDNETSIVNTRDWSAPYWSSTGQRDPQVPETLTYQIKDGLWSILQIDVQPFQDLLQQDSPIYAARAVRFRFGNPRPPRNEIEWTYTSPEFPMLQENSLQQFKLPQPALCWGGGYVEIELLGRVQRHEMNGLFYLGASHVRSQARPLSAAFSLERVGPSEGESFALVYNPNGFDAVLTDLHILNPPIDRGRFFFGNEYIEEDELFGEFERNPTPARWFLVNRGDGIDIHADDSDFDPDAYSP